MSRDELFKGKCLGGISLGDFHVEVIAQGLVVLGEFYRSNCPKDSSPGGIIQG